MLSEIIVEFPMPLTDNEKKMIYGYKGEVVRCKDCHYCKPFNEVWELPKRDFTICRRSNDVVESEDYCSWGIRKFEEGKNKK